MKKYPDLTMKSFGFVSTDTGITGSTVIVKVIEHRAPYESKAWIVTGVAA